MKNLFNHFSDANDQKFIRQLREKIKWAAMSEKLYITPFLDPRKQYFTIQAIKSFPEIKYRIYGGYPEAERNKIYCWPESWPQPKLQGIGFIQLGGNFSMVEISHRDFLGAILNLGIKREKVGDIILLHEGKGAQVVLDEDIINYVLSNLSSVHRVNVTGEIISDSNLQYQPSCTREISGTVSSLRLDAVASLGFGCSRSKSVLLIKAERVKINWRPVRNPANLIKKGDTISLSGRGRIVVENLLGETRTGRKRIILKKIL